MEGACEGARKHQCHRPATATPAHLPARPADHHAGCGSQPCAAAPTPTAGWPVRRGTAISPHRRSCRSKSHDQCWFPTWRTTRSTACSPSSTSASERAARDRLLMSSTATAAFTTGSETEHQPGGYRVDITHASPDYEFTVSTSRGTPVVLRACFEQRPFTERPPDHVPLHERRDGWRLASAQFR
ncbi:DUF6907 domain-containing protein [Streptomyces sp. NPDC047706]|uniref:DUF6907 domain-containing protein n=1 Tax=Streptomyces sp. NPDC047706 TaxID=3365486 RepID=UPI003710168D